METEERGRIFPREYIASFELRGGGYVQGDDFAFLMAVSAFLGN